MSRQAFAAIGLAGGFTAFILILALLERKRRK